MAKQTIYYVAGIPIAYIGSDGVLRRERLSEEDRAQVIESFDLGPIGPITAEHWAPEPLCLRLVLAVVHWRRGDDD